jgi:hypothetical protein
MDANVVGLDPFSPRFGERRIIFAAVATDIVRRH